MLFPKTWKQDNKNKILDVNIGCWDYLNFIGRKKRAETILLIYSLSPLIYLFMITLKTSQHLLSVKKNVIFNVSVHNVII